MGNQKMNPGQNRLIIIAVVAAMLLCYAPVILHMSGSVPYLLLVGAIGCAMALLLEEQKETKGIRLCLMTNSR